MDHSTVGARQGAEASEFECIGSLIDIPFPRLLVKMHRSALSGTLHLEASEQRTWLHLDRGLPDGVHDPNSEIYLGMVLRELGLLSDEDFNASLMKMAETGQLQGQVLLDMGAITQDQLVCALRIQQIRKASQLLSIKTATYRFEEGARLPERMMAQPVEPAAVIYHGIRNCYEEAELDVHLAPLRGKLCETCAKLAAFLDVVELPEDERADLELLSQHRSADDFAARASAGRTTARMLLLTLFWCDLLVVSEPAEIEAPEPARPPSGPPVLPARVRERVDLKYEQACQGDLLALLQVPADADTERVTVAYTGLAKVFHPDKFVRFQDPVVARQVELIALRLNEAFTTLSDPQGRAAYLNKVVVGAGRPITLNPAAAEQAYLKAKLLIQRKNTAEALVSMRLAAKLNPTEATYRARALWLEYLCERESTKGDKRQLKRTLLGLRNLSPSNYWVNRLLANACQLLGQTPEYIRYLEQAASIRPSDIDTARELRRLKVIEANETD